MMTGMSQPQLTCNEVEMVMPNDERYNGEGPAFHRCLGRHSPQWSPAAAPDDNQRPSHLLLLACHISPDGRWESNGLG
jgi:hypothetical protein